MDIHFSGNVDIDRQGFSCRFFRTGFGYRRKTGAVPIHQGQAGIRFSQQQGHFLADATGRTGHNTALIAKVVFNFHELPYAVLEEQIRL